VAARCSTCHPWRSSSFKQTQLLANLDRIGGVTPREILPPLGASSWSYRRRARLGVKYVAKKGRVLVGFRERAAPYVADLHECRVLAAPAGELIDPLAAMVQSLSIAERVPQIEIAVAENGCALVLRVLASPGREDLDRLAEFERERGVRIYLQPGGLDTVAPLSGDAAALRYSLPEFDLELEFLPTDFVQINAELNALMVSRAVELLQLVPTDTVLDLFLRHRQLLLARGARRAGLVVGVEGDNALVGRARRNAELNRIQNAEFHHGRSAARALTCLGRPALRPRADRPAEGGRKGDSVAHRPL
jgi:23S rRNA (uracil1939-C5)-methyltransferase